MKHTSKILAIIATLILAVKLLSDEPKQADKPAPSKPVELESVKAAKEAAMKAATNNPAPPAAPPPPRPIAIVIRDALMVATPQGVLWIVPDRYQQDLTNLFRFQKVPKIVLEEP